LIKANKYKVIIFTGLLIASTHDGIDIIVHRKISIFKSMHRRSFLLSTGTLLLSPLIAGCQQNNQGVFSIKLLKGSVPSQVVNQFTKGIQPGQQSKFIPVEQLQDIFKQLQTWQLIPKAGDKQGFNIPLPWGDRYAGDTADLVTLGDYWLQNAIEQKLIQPLDQEQLKTWSALPKKWQALVTRNEQGNLDTKGKIWAAPYRWGGTVIVYRRDKLEQLGLTIKDWGDLWHSQLHQRISLLNHPREIVGFVLKKLGQSYNTENLDKIPQLEQELLSLKPQIKVFNSNRYIEPLLMGDTYAAVGWSGDIIPTIGRYPQLAVVMPASGTSLWADLWVIPKKKNQINENQINENQINLLYQWINYCWSPNVAQQIALLTKTNSPISVNIQPSDIPEPLHNFLLANSQLIDKSEFLLPLSKETQKQYESKFNLLKS
jgi:putative spermidine/putrescine transport system substrate-binding protein